MAITDTIDGEKSSDSTSTLNALQRSFVLANRNKPLPIPDQDEVSWSTQKVAGGGEPSSQAEKVPPTCAPKLVVEAETTTSALAATFDGRRDDIDSPRASLRSMLNRSSKLFRNPMIPTQDSHQLSSYIHGNTLICSSDSSLTSSNHSRSPSPSVSHTRPLSSNSATECAIGQYQMMQVPHSRDVNRQSGRKQAHLSSAQSDQNALTQFGFIRRTSISQGEHTRPEMARSGKSYSSSTSSRSGNRSDEKGEGRHRQQSRLSHPIFAQLGAPSDKRASKEDDEVETVSNVRAESSDGFRNHRPPLVRMRSRSVEALPHGKQMGSFQGAKPLSSVSLSKTPSSGQVRAVNERLSGTGGSPSRQSELQREGTLSRLAGSIRRTAHHSLTSSTANADKPSNSSSMSAIARTTDQKRRSAFNLKTMSWQSSPTAADKAVKARLTSQSASQSSESSRMEDPPAVPPKEPLRLRNDAWWEHANGQPAKKGTEQDSSLDSTLGRLEAAQLATAIIAGDDNIEDRMAAALESPKEVIRSFPDEQPGPPPNLMATETDKPSLSPACVTASSEGPAGESVVDEVREDVDKYATFIDATLDLSSLEAALTNTTPSSTVARSVRLTSPPTAYNPHKLPRSVKPAALEAMQKRKSSLPEVQTTLSSFSDESRPLRPDFDKGTPRRSSTSLGMYSISKGKRRGSVDRGPTLDIVDDIEFLRALEDVRRINQERIRSGGRQRTWSRKSNASSREDVDHSSSSSCKVNSYPMDSPLSENSTCTESSVETPDVYCGIARPSPLELGVGKASGKLRDGAFINDDDWKKEVKALFVIRELVLTERSYARHLEALLHAIRPKQAALSSTSTMSSLPSMQAPVRRSTTPNLLMSSASSLTLTRQTDPPPPPHIAFLRNLLPQLITLSRTLASQIDENPTAAGVGAAFRLVSGQMESAFVAWSAAIKDIMDALRVNENGKSRSRFRIGMIPTTPFGHSTQTPAASAPCSPVRARTTIRQGSQTEFLPPLFPDSPISMTIPAAEEEMVVDAAGAVNERSTIAKRRSTISAVSSAAATGWQAKLSALSASSSAESEDGHSTASRRLSYTRMMPNNPACKSQSGTSTPQRPELTIKTSSSQQRRLTAMDIAIMPTQRIPRYLLLLRDLHLNTPPSSLSHARIQRSLNFIQRVATDCDRASKMTRVASKPR